MTLTSKLKDGNENLIVFIGGEEDEELLQKGRKESFLIIKADDWNRDLSPWPAQRVFKKGEDFAGGADETIDELLQLLESYRNRYRTIAITGYSLAGLFALYACTKTDVFDCCLSVSGSLWYPGWTEYLQNHPVHCRRVYLSLGDTEKNTRNPLMAQVEDNTRKTEELLKEYTEVILEMNPGNHFNDPTGRIIRGIQKLFA